MGGSLIELLAYVRVDDQGLPWWQIAFLAPIGVGIAMGLLWLVGKVLTPRDKRRDPPAG